MPSSQARKARRALARGEEVAAVVAEPETEPSGKTEPRKPKKGGAVEQAQSADAPEAEPAMSVGKKGSKLEPVKADKAAKSSKKRVAGKEKSAAGAAGEAEDEGADEADGSSAKMGKKKVACTLFVGQLPYQAGAKEIERHFQQAACGGAVRVRLLTKRESSASRGMAFVEMASEAAVHSALRLHHSCIMGRRINVERTVGGGGNDPARQQKLQSLRECQGSQMIKSAKDLVERILPAADTAEEADDEAPPGCTVDDVDDRLLEFVTSIQPTVAEAALQECTKIDFTGVNNRKAYLMGVLRRKVADSDQFGTEKYSYANSYASSGGTGKSKRKERDGEAEGEAEGEAKGDGEANPKKVAKAQGGKVVKKKGASEEGAAPKKTKKVAKSSTKEGAVVKKPKAKAKAA